MLKVAYYNFNIINVRVKNEKGQSYLMNMGSVVVDCGYYTCGCIS